VSTEASRRRGRRRVRPSCDTVGPGLSHTAVYESRMFDTRFRRHAISSPSPVQQGGSRTYDIGARRVKGACDPALQALTCDEATRAVEVGVR
jgi:hypothetical protein